MSAGDRRDEAENGQAIQRISLVLAFVYHLADDVGVGVRKEVLQLLFNCFV